MLIQITTQEVCQRVDLSTETLVEIVEHGIVEPEGEQPEQWMFSVDYVCTIRRATRLHRDLGIDWAGVALVLDLLEERDRLRRENQMLQRRLQRFEI
ncbi:chaperone modulatory protein CbpM [Proteobacteria bacterium 005FR1]|nr:chaperone modulatory protein CbpM [Proteobacteria bacterium 005FR1]